MADRHGLEADRLGFLAERGQVQVQRLEGEDLWVQGKSRFK